MPRSCKMLAGEHLVDIIECPSAGNLVKKPCLSELAEHKAEVQTDANCLYRFLGSCIDVAGQSNLMACDLTEVFKRVALWNRELCRVSPYYAVKCNTDLPLLKLLAALDVNFDCASMGEIDTVVNQSGADVSRIIYANPCKFKRDILFAKRVGVRRTTFDSEMELHKLARLWPEVECVLRIAPKQFKAQCQLSNKFGVAVNDVPGLLALAKDLGLNVVGISFHVGSGCAEADAWAETVRLSAKLAVLFPSYGFQFRLLDIGGGFPGDSPGMGNSDLPAFQDITKMLREALDEEFPADCGVELIAEPGRFFASAPYTAMTEVYACKRLVEEDGTTVQQLFAGDGVYGSFNNTIFDHQIVRLCAIISAADPIQSSEDRIRMLPADLMDQKPQAKFINALDDVKTEGEEMIKTIVFGPTCDGIDSIYMEQPLPEMHFGDWLVWRDMGAYTLSAASSFNGMPRAKVFYFVHNASADQLALTRRALDLTEPGELV